MPLIEIQIIFFRAGKATSCIPISSQCCPLVCLLPLWLEQGGEFFTDEKGDPLTGANMLKKGRLCGVYCGVSSFLW